MRFTNILAATAAMTLAAAPVVAQAASQPVSAREASEVSDAENMRGGFLIPMIAVIAIILGILAATGGGNDDPPHSP